MTPGQMRVTHRILTILAEEIPAGEEFTHLEWLLERAAEEALFCAARMDSQAEGSESA